MEIFDWVKDIEETYKYLIDNAKAENIKEIQRFRTQQEKLMDTIIKRKQELINSMLTKVSEDVHDGIKMFNSQFIKELNNLEEQFNKDKKKIIKIIIEKLGLEF